MNVTPEQIAFAKLVEIAPVIAVTDGRNQVIVFTDSLNHIVTFTACPFDPAFDPAYGISLDTEQEAYTYIQELIYNGWFLLEIEGSEYSYPKADWATLKQVPCLLCGKLTPAIHAFAYCGGWVGDVCYWTHHLQDQQPTEVKPHV